MSGSSKRKARRERARALLQQVTLDKATLTNFANRLEKIVNEVMPSGDSPSTSDAQPQSVPAQAGADLDVPVLVERHDRERERDGRTYEEANWDKLSPKFRDAHNRLLQARGM